MYYILTCATETTISVHKNIGIFFSPSGNRPCDLWSERRTTYVSFIQFYPNINI